MLWKYYEWHLRQKFLALFSYYWNSTIHVTVVVFDFGSGFFVFSHLVCRVHLPHPAGGAMRDLRPRVVDHLADDAAQTERQFAREEPHPGCAQQRK